MAEAPQPTAPHNPDKGQPQPELKRALGLLALIAFGVGDILGAGVYGLVGKISGIVGHAAWISYVVAGFTAALTGFTYAEYTSRYPKAGGAAHFTQSAFKLPILTFLVIFFVALSGLFSVATTSRVFADYATSGINLPPFFKEYVTPLLFVLIVAIVTARGIVLSSATNVICSIVEVSALAMIIIIGLRYIGGVEYLAFDVANPDGDSKFTMVMMGAAIAFFAFIGFEDMANLSEEVRDPERTVPIAICVAILITSIIYCLIAVVAVSVQTPAVLAHTKTPLIEVVKTASPGFPIKIFNIIPAFAVFNTGLLNLLMASRLLYGMARGPQNQLPRVLSYVHPEWRTPVIALAVATVVAMIMIVSSKDVGTLAGGTTTFLLVVFALLHIGLIKTKIVERHQPRPRFQIPIFIPVLGAITCLVILTKRDLKDLKIAGWLMLGALVLFIINRYFLGRREVEAID